MWIAGAKSPNPEGGKWHSARSVKGMLERFVKHNITSHKLQSMYDKLTENQKLEMLTQILPYVAPRLASNSLTTDEINELYSKVEEAIKANEASKVS